LAVKKVYRKARQEFATVRKETALLIDTSHKPVVVQIAKEASQTRVILSQTARHFARLAQIPRKGGLLG